MTPKRIQRKRTAGWKMPENTIYVGRPTKWGNPYKINEKVDRANAVALFKEYIEQYVPKEELEELKGKNLACWCKEGSPCHADVLLELANKTSLLNTENK
ncbi:MAG: DUF4326 domain-containing protein [Pseudobacter sp.]|uniref:DUF4326 domain-containing protein n=1 Tax=Pseudobacter sp. TaxID=2045420 RepID=UPI003F7F7C52